MLTCLTMSGYRGSDLNIPSHTNKHGVIISNESRLYSSSFGGLGSPYLICAMSPTTISDTGIWMTWPLRMTVNFCSCSMRLCSPRNCFSLDQSLKAVTSTTMMTEKRMAAPSIQPACASPSSSTPDAVCPHTVGSQEGGGDKVKPSVSYKLTILDVCMRSVNNDTRKSICMLFFYIYLICMQDIFNNNVCYLGNKQLKKCKDLHFALTFTVAPWWMVEG